MKLEESIFLNENNSDFTKNGFTTREAGKDVVLTAISSDAVKNGVIKIPEGVTIIGDTSTSLAASSTSVAYGAFQLEEIRFPDSVKTIGSDAFSGFHVKHFDLSPNIETIGDYAFADNPILEELYIPDVLSVGKMIVNSGCTNLKSLGLGCSDLVELNDNFFVDTDNNSELPPQLTTLYLDTSLRYLFNPKYKVGECRLGDIFHESDPGVFVAGKENNDEKENADNN